MFHHYIFIQRLANQLSDEIRNAILLTCFSQQKDELILGFSKPNQAVFYIKASLEPQINLLSFPAQFHRAKKNSVDLFASITGDKVITVFAYNCDRSFAIQFQSGSYLIFKLHGRRSNIILIDKKAELTIFKNNLPEDRVVSKHSLNREFSLSTINESQLIQAEQLMGSAAISLLNDSQNYHERDFERKKKCLMELEQAWISGEIYLLENQPPELSFQQNGNEIASFSNPILAANAFYSNLIYSWHLTQEKKQIIQKLQAQVKQTQNYLIKTYSKHNEIKNRRSFEEIGHLIMANLHAISPGTTAIQVDDLYNGGQISINLKSELSPQKMAEVYYRKAKNEKIEIEKLAQNLAKKQEHLLALQTQILKIEKVESVKQLKSGIENETPEMQSRQKIIRPFHEFEYKGFQIWVGKNAQSNDKLTFGISKKEDFWLHARDVSGSHVIVKNPGKLFELPNDVLETAAQLAAYHSKRKTDTLSPVAYTQRKYIRKSKNAPAGKVIMEREAVIMVKPELVLKRLND